MKDPRFNMYPDNWIGGTDDFTLEQEGAYLRLLFLQSKKGKFTQAQAFDILMQRTRGNTAVCTELWQFLLPKFATDGQFYWSERMAKELEKSRIHSEKQKLRINKRWGNNSGNTAVLPVNETGIGNGSGTKEKGVQGEKHRTTMNEQPPTDFSDYEAWTQSIIDHNDPLFEQMLVGEGLKPNGQLATLARDHLQLLARYPKMRPQSQQTFRYSLLKSITENLNKSTHETKPNQRLAIDFSPGKDFGKF